MTARRWIVICPEPHVEGGLWHRWLRERCVAVGWPPDRFRLDGPTSDAAWAWVRRRLDEMRVGDTVVPFLLRWRIGPVGTIEALWVRDDEWRPTGAQGLYDKTPDEAELGRRIDVRWELDNMPPPGRVAEVPHPQRTRRPLARHAVEELTPERYAELVRLLRAPRTWVNLH